MPFLMILTFLSLFWILGTKIDTANRKFQMNFIEELIRTNFASEPTYQTNIREKTSDLLKIHSTNFQADEEIISNFYQKLAQ